MVSNKLTYTASLIRLSLCLLTSAGIHGGVAFYDWASQPATVHDGSSAVVVALVSSAEDPAFSVIDNRDSIEKQSQVIPEQQTKPPVPAIPSRTVVKPTRVVPPKPEPAVVADEIVEKPTEECVQPDPVCPEPREALSGLADEVSSIGGASPEVQVSSTGDNQSAERKNSGQTEGPLVEAMPNYRNNPLPEYPYIARQRHWEGVVWLLVDVSADGLVDDVEIEQSCGHRVLDRAASRTVQRWEFTPATRAGLPVESQVRIPVRFSLEDS